MTSPDTSAALAGIGADLSVSVSFVIANELVAAAREQQVGDDELVAMLVAFVFTATSLRVGVERLSRAMSSGKASTTARRGVLEFALLLLSIAQRIGLSLCVQVLAFSVRSNEPSRAVRITTLLAAVVFFVFFESLSHRGRVST
jgi:hypothetical protein